jgi:hypothetical protein
VSISLITNSPSYLSPDVQENSVQSSSQQQPGQLSGADAQLTEDTVQISELAQVQQMALRGVSAPTIAGITGLMVSQVDSDLGILSAVAVTSTSNVASPPSTLSVQA